MLAESKTIYAIKESLSKSIDSESGLIAFKNQILAKSKVSISDNLSNGHLSSNVCMIAASFLNKKPIEISHAFEEGLQKLSFVKDVKTAGPGFLNIFLEQSCFLDNFLDIKDITSLVQKDDKKSIQIEYVSANPTGPLHVGHGRGAAYGDALARILKFYGHDVSTEYYVNDAGRQADILACSIFLRRHNLLEDDYPNSAYKGSYIKDISNMLEKDIDFSDEFIDQIEKKLSDPEEHIDYLIEIIKAYDKDYWLYLKEFCLKKVISLIKADLDLLNVHHDCWFFESSLGQLDNTNSLLSKAIKDINQKNKYEKNDALWLKSTVHGDDKDRVLVRENGRGTYLASDVAYHKDKLDRGFDEIINVWGADHHGYIKRIESAIESIGYSKDKLVVQLVQFANLIENGKKLKMSTRSGEFYQLSDLITSIGSGAARFYYLSKQADQHFDFDITLAKSKTKENLFYYIQYAHARICSLTKKYNEGDNEELSQFSDENFSKCDDLILKVSKFNEIIEAAAQKYQPHLIIFFLRDVAQTFHKFYNDNNILDSAKDERENIMLCMVNVRHVIAKCLGLLGIEPIEKM